MSEARYVCVKELWIRTELTYMVMNIWIYLYGSKEQVSARRCMFQRKPDQRVTVMRVPLKRTGMIWCVATQTLTMISIQMNILFEILRAMDAEKEIYIYTHTVHYFLRSLRLYIRIMYTYSVCYMSTFNRALWGGWVIVHLF